MKAAVIWFTWEMVGRWWGDGGEVVGRWWGDSAHLGGAADVEEVRRLPPVGGDDVHGRHGQAWQIAGRSWGEHGEIAGRSWKDRGEIAGRLWGDCGEIAGR